MKSYMFRKDSVTSHSSCRKLQKVSGTDQKIFQSVPETFYPVTIHILRSRSSYETKNALFQYSFYSFHTLLNRLPRCRHIDPLESGSCLSEDLSAVQPQLCVVDDPPVQLIGIDSGPSEIQPQEVGSLAVNDVHSRHVVLHIFLYVGDIFPDIFEHVLIPFIALLIRRLCRHKSQYAQLADSRGIDLIYDSSHAHHHHDADEPHAHDSIQDDEHQHLLGVEPHVWSSAYNAQIIAGNIVNALCAIDKGNEEVYMERYKSLCNQIEHTDSLICHMLSAPNADRAFMIYHPALSYFARDYGLHQISIEENGKEPSPSHLKNLIDTCKKEKVRVIFVQPEFDRRNAEIIAKQTGTKVIPINPLSYDWEEEMLNIAKELVVKN